MKRNSFIYCLTRSIARLILSIFYRIETKGNETFPNQGPVVILPKHQYWTDIPLVSIAFKPLLYFVAKKELFKYPFIGHYLSLLGGIPVDREQSIRTLDSFKMLFSLLRSGEKIVIFPEGTYVREKVGLGKSRLLGMILKLQSEMKHPIPFVPVGIRYGESKGWRRNLEVTIGHPLFAEHESEATSLTSRVMDEISGLSRLPRYSNKLQNEDCGNPHFEIRI